MESDFNARFRKILDLAIPIIQAPLAGVAFADMASAVSEVGGLGSLACAMLTSAQMREEISRIRKHTSRPLNLNFFCHRPPPFEPGRAAGWRKRLESYYRELGLDLLESGLSTNRAPFDATSCEIIEEFAPEVVSFHFGLPDKRLVDRVKATGARVFSSATTVSEARWLEEHGCDAIIAQGYEAGGHRGMFLSTDTSTQIGTMALVPQVVDAVRVPVIATGGISDGRGIAAAFALGASAVQLGTAYLFCPEARISLVHREMLGRCRDDETALTNVFTGRPARGIVNRLMRELGPMSSDAPDFPLAAEAVVPLGQAALAKGSGDFVPLWAGQAARLSRELPAGELTKYLAAAAREQIAGQSSLANP